MAPKKDDESRKDDESKKDYDPEVREALMALMRLRKIKTLTEISQTAGCALSHLSKTYRGQSSMSVGLLLRICNAFNLKRSQFFRMGEAGHQFNQDLEAEIEGENASEASNRRILEAMVAKYPDMAREVMAEYFKENE